MRNKTEIIKVQDSSIFKGDQIVKMLEKFGLLWEVIKAPLFVADPTKHDSNILDDNQPNGTTIIKQVNDEGGASAKYVNGTDFYATQRKDDGHVFATVKSGYQILQNWDLCELIQEVAGDFDLKVSRGGALQYGGKVFIQIATGSLEGIGDNFDTVKKYITAINSHDGTASLGFGMTNTTISCSNTFHSAHSSLTSKIRHTMSMKDKIEVLRNELTAVQEEEKTLYTLFKNMANRQATDKDIKNVIQLVTDVDPNLNIKEAKSLFSTRKINQAQALTIRIAEETIEKGGSLWGLFSGVTKYTTRDLSTPKRENGVLESKFLGGAKRIDNKVFSFLTESMN